MCLVHWCVGDDRSDGLRSAFLVGLDLRGKMKMFFLNERRRSQTLSIQLAAYYSCQTRRRVVSAADLDALTDGRQRTGNHVFWSRPYCDQWPDFTCCFCGSTTDIGFLHFLRSRSCCSAPTLATFVGASATPSNVHDAFLASYLNAARILHQQSHESVLNLPSFG